MNLIISEKGDLASKVAAAVGAKYNKAKGCYIGNGFYVVSSRGHLFEMLKPNEINAKYQKWNLNDLPILPTSIPKT